MPPPLLLDPARYDLTRVALTREQIYEMLPHRGEFMQLDGVHALNVEEKEIIGFRHVRADEWWARGHIPGRPIFPGILMIETVAHLASVFYEVVMKRRRFMAFAGVDAVKFRDAVYPPAELLILARAVELKSRRLILQSQILVDDTLVFEGQVTGMLMDPVAPT